MHLKKLNAITFHHLTVQRTLSLPYLHVSLFSSLYTVCLKCKWDNIRIMRSNIWKCSEKMLKKGPGFHLTERRWDGRAVRLVITLSQALTRSTVAILFPLYWWKLVNISLSWLPVFFLSIPLIVYIMCLSIS